MNAKVDEYLKKISRWQEEAKALRAILLDCALTEELKWGQPCYTFRKANVALIASFKNYCALSFFKGTLLNDADNMLEKPGENTRAARLIRFTNVREVVEREATLKAYIHEAIEVEKAGTKVDFKKNEALVFPEEFQRKLDEDSAFKSAFELLTPGRQKAYNLYFSAAKQSETRASRVEKYRQRILSGKGINDCICGFSRKLPHCDGSHKYPGNPGKGPSAGRLP